ncbi:hypothetical protein BC937DRAFT_94591 [Endogone sp. FLAS-F59071]|nr:hypothetical protein BC937DRAFT_94591 [Endogone sp. FLAS-F59071]|eukprot:RUS13926.1 hypothetical protein BC937DRAFT_94591 [Endogone sp. FLAS-F59071]
MGGSSDPHTATPSPNSSLLCPSSATVFSQPVSVSQPVHKPTAPNQEGDEEERMRRTVHVSNLDYGVEYKLLKQFLAREIGPVKYVQIASRDGWSRGFAFVEFADPNSAEAALERGNGLKLLGRPMEGGGQLVYQLLAVTPFNSPSLIISSILILFPISYFSTFHLLSTSLLPLLFSLFLSPLLFLCSSPPPSYFFSSFLSSSLYSPTTSLPPPFYFSTTPFPFSHSSPPHFSRAFGHVRPRACYIDPHRNDRLHRPTWDEPFTNLYVQNIRRDTTEEEFVGLFAHYGPLERCTIKREGGAIGSETIWGFVNYVYPADAKKVRFIHSSILTLSVFFQQALQTLNGRFFKDRSIMIHIAKTRTPPTHLTRHSTTRRFPFPRAAAAPAGPTPSLPKPVSAPLPSPVDAPFMTTHSLPLGVNPCNVYVKNLDDEIFAHDSDLEDFFAAYGGIASARIMRWARDGQGEGEGVSRGFGFVMFQQAESAARAIAETDGMCIGKKTLVVCYAERKEDRKLRAMYGVDTRMYQPPAAPNPIAIQPQHIAAEFGPFVPEPTFLSPFQPPPLPFMLGYNPYYALPPTSFYPEAFDPTTGAFPFPMHQPHSMILPPLTHPEHQHPHGQFGPFFTWTPLAPHQHQQHQHVHQYHSPQNHSHQDRITGRDEKPGDEHTDEQEHHQAPEAPTLDVEAPLVDITTCSANGPDHKSEAGDPSPVIVVGRARALSDPPFAKPQKEKVTQGRKRRARHQGDSENAAPESTVIQQQGKPKAALDSGNQQEGRRRFPRPRNNVRPVSSQWMWCQPDVSHKTATPNERDKDLVEFSLASQGDRRKKRESEMSTV